MWPHQVAELSDFLLCVEFGAQVEKVKEGAQAETDDKVLSVVKGQNPAGMFFGKPVWD